MATLRTILNRVLKTVGEEQVASSTAMLTDDYHILVAEFVNQFKEEIEDAHQWRVLRTVATATIGSGESSASLAGTNERSRLLREHDARYGRLLPLVFDVTDASNPQPLEEMDLAELLYRHELDTETSDRAQYFAVDANDDGTIHVHVYPAVNNARSIKAFMIIPQDYLDENDLDVNIKVPQRPLIQGTVWFALSERGEELGQNTMFTEERYRTALDDAISRDSGEQGDIELVPV